MYFYQILSTNSLKKSIGISLESLFVHFWAKGVYRPFPCSKNSFFKNDPSLLCKNQICEHGELKRTSQLCPVYPVCSSCPFYKIKERWWRGKRAELRRSARRQQLIINVSSWRFYNQQEKVLNQKSLRVIDRFVFNNLTVDNAGQTAVNKNTGSMIFPFFLLVSKTDKPLGDDTFQNQSVKPHLLKGPFLRAVL